MEDFKGEYLDREENTNEQNSSFKSEVSFSSVSHDLIFKELLKAIKPFDFKTKFQLSEVQIVADKHYQIGCAEYLLAEATKQNWGFCKNQGQVYLYNGTFWKVIA